MAEQAMIAVPSGALVSTETRGTNPAFVYLASLQPTGRRTMQATLAKVAALLGTSLEAAPWGQLQYEHVQALRTKLAEMHKPATVNKYMAAIRGVMRAAWRMGLIEAAHYQRIADVKGVTGSTLPAGRAWALASWGRSCACARWTKPRPGSEMPPCWPWPMRGPAPCRAGQPRHGQPHGDDGRR
jgi:hypothetical protein